MDYTELIVTVPAADREPAEAAVLAYAAGGIYTEDYSDVESVAPLVGGTPYLDEELAAAYIYVDNFAEMMQYDSENYRIAAAKIDEVLRDWAEDFYAAHGRGGW